MVYQGAARVVCGETLQTHDFGGWLHEFHRDAVSRWIRGVAGAIPAPDIIQLTRYDRVPAHEAPFTRRGLFQRDDYTCQYCGRRGGEAALSVDHVVPRSRGGSTTWANCVLACVRCNTRKGSRTPRQVGLRLRAKPKRPRWSPYLSVRPDDWMDCWRRFASPHDLKRLGICDSVTQTPGAT